MIWEKAFETGILPYRNRSPVQVRLLGEIGQLKARTLGNPEGCDVEGSRQLRWGHVEVPHDSCQCITKPLQYQSGSNEN